MNFEPQSLPWQEAYKVLIGSVLPRPIAFVSTVDANGIANVAPFSFFTAICPKPMLICFAPMLRGTDGARKDTLENIIETRQFVVNVVGESIVDQMNACSAEYPPEVDEFDQVGLTKGASSLVKPPRVMESQVQLECELEQVLPFGEGPGSGSLVIGRVVMIHVRDELYQNGRIDTAQLLPVGRMAGNMYTRSFSDTFMLERPITPNPKG
ncbi:flavin reductase family protein [Paenibacillus sp. HJGM_3]|uniref:flavin reductase family protein n=1 Tax=Paenibacillus sp. HJGM_3 TaxID=3379816 RepID=UPI00385A7A0B